MLLLELAGVPCRAQYPEDFHPYTFDVGYGGTGVHGRDGNNFQGFGVYQAGGGMALMGKPTVQYDHGKHKSYRTWTVFGTVDFLYGSAKLRQGIQVQQIINSNPQSPALLSATNGEGKFYNLTAGPRLQVFPWQGYVNLYAQAEGGWLRRSVDLTGMPTEGTVLQPNNPAVFSQAGNSGAVRLRAGVATGLKGYHLFFEGGFLQGFGINHGTRLAAIWSGGLRW
jgi:hypothetical protein